jgi:outer membrane protein TolC
MSKAEQRAAEARTLQGNSTFNAILDEIREEAKQVFLNPHSTIETIGAAHDRVRAVQIILDAIQARLDAEAIEQKKGQHRGSD